MMPENMIYISGYRNSGDGKPIAKKYVKEMLKARRMSLTTCAKLICEHFPEYETTAQNLSNKISRGTLRDFEIAQVAEVCGYNLLLVEASNDDKNSEKAVHEKRNGNEMVYDGIETSESSNFGVVIFIGKNAHEAADKFNKLKKNGMNAVEELTLCSAIGKELDCKIKPAGISL